jgi:hypothetical protein
MFRSYPIEEVLSILIHIFVYSKIYKYKHKTHPIGPVTFSSLQQQNIIAKINSQSLTSFGINSLIIFTLISMSLASKRNNETNPKELGYYPNYMFVYYNQLVAPGIIGILFVILVFYRNTGLRKAFRESMTNILLNFKEQFVNFMHVNDNMQYLDE